MQKWWAPSPENQRINGDRGSQAKDEAETVAWDGGPVSGADSEEPIVVHNLADLTSRPQIPAPPEPAVLPTWDELSVLEPRLLQLESWVRRVARENRANSEWCANAEWYGWVKPILVMLVGWNSAHPDPMLRTERAYELAYEYLYELLPDCSHDAALSCGWDRAPLPQAYQAVLGEAYDEYDGPGEIYEVVISDYKSFLQGGKGQIQ